MTFDTTYKNLKKRIFDILDEFSSSSDTVFISDSDKEHIESRIPDAVNSALVRMYESLPIGTKTVVQRVNKFLPIAYDRGIPDGDRTIIEFTTPTADIAMFFRFFGNGNIVIYTENNKVVGTISLDGTSTLMTKKIRFSLPEAGFYRVGVSGNAKIMDFCVYADNGETDVKAICNVGEASFELPGKFEKFLFVKGIYGNVDVERIVTQDGFAFLPTSQIGSCDSLTVQYRTAPDVISDATEDSFVFDLSPLAFEALTCIAASEVCREQDAAKHTRLIYKYNDLCEGLRGTFDDKKKRNTFFKASRKMRW